MKSLGWGVRREWVGLSERKAGRGIGLNTGSLMLKRRKKKVLHEGGGGAMEKEVKHVARGWNN